MSELLKRIEEARDELHQLVERYGIHAPQVVEQSQRLDGLLGIFNTIYKNSLIDCPISQIYISGIHVDPQKPTK